MGGPDASLGVGCGPFDCDSDLDVDVVDFAGFQIDFGSSPQVVIETVTVGNPGNPGEQSRIPNGDHNSYGGVAYTYSIGTYEVTAGQYTALLNAVAATDTYGLYHTRMDYDADPSRNGCNIKRHGAPGSYTYSVAPDWADRPVNYVGFGDAMRFANWLHNGQLQ
jgi:formylglycine-generating enzyme required for sulfatase activity